MFNSFVSLQMQLFCFLFFFSFFFIFLFWKQKFVYLYVVAQKSLLSNVEIVDFFGTEYAMD